MGLFDWLDPQPETADNSAVSDMSRTAGWDYVAAADKVNAQKEAADYQQQDAAATAALPPLPDDPQSQMLRQQMDDIQKWNQYYAEQAHNHDAPPNVSRAALDAYDATHGDDY